MKRIDGASVIEIRIAEGSDEDGIRSLFKTCFGKELSRKEWTWKYKDSPWGSAATIALDGDTVVAHYGGLKTKFCSPSRQYEVYQPCDVMTHPAYRARFFTKRGAMVKAGELFYRANFMDFAFGFPSERHAVLGTKQLGYTEHGFVTVLTKEISGSRNPLIGRPLLRVDTGWSVLDESDIDILWEKVKDNFSLAMEKNGRYIFWRYRNHPSKQYEPIVVRGRFTKGLKALAIFSIRENELLVMDFFGTAGKDREFLCELIEAIALKRSVSVVKVWVNQKEQAFKELNRRGYSAEPGIPYIFKIIDSEINPSFLFSNYCYRQGDYDAA